MNRQFKIDYNIQKFSTTKKSASFLQINSEILFFLMLIFPQTYKLIKIPFLSIILISSLSVILLSGKIKLHKSILLWFLFYISFGVIWGALGLLNNNEYKIDFLRLNVVWVLIYMIFTIYISRQCYIEKAEKIMIWSVLIIAVININYFLNGIGVYNLKFLTYFDMGQNIGIHDGYSQMTILNIGNLFFLVPFLFSAIAVSRGKSFAGFSSKFLSFVLFLCIISVFLTGRRMLLIITFLTPFIYFFVVIIIDHSMIRLKLLIKVVSIVFLVFASVGYIFYQKLGWDFQNFITRLQFTGQYSIGVEYRINMIKYLVYDVYKRNLFLGTGGGGAPFEVYFIKIFHETGVIGLSIYLGLYFWSFYQIIIKIRKRICNKEQGIPLLVGSISFFIAQWSNPFASYDFMWSLFLPIAYINTYLIKSNKNL